jgi:hypothetical protein
VSNEGNAFKLIGEVSDGIESPGDIISISERGTGAINGVTPAKVQREIFTAFGIDGH